MSFTGSVVIVNFNSGEHLAECLKSVAAHAPEARVVVIDNASSDGSERVADVTIQPIRDEAGRVIFLAPIPPPHGAFRIRRAFRRLS